MKNAKPLVSVVIPTYNRAQYLVDALESVFKQTYEHMEIIVVDDGSTDETRQILKNYSGKIRYIFLNRGERSKARNKGIQQSQGEYIAFLDSDDWWHHEKTEKQVEVLEKDPDIDLVYTGLDFIDAEGDPYNGQIPVASLERIRPSLYEDLMTRNVISGSASSVIGRRACFSDGFLFDEAMTACEDLDLWRRLSMHYRFYKIDLPLVKLRVHSSNTQSRLVDMAHGYEKIIEKIIAEIPPENKYYRNEAIIKLWSHIWDLYRDGGNRRGFFLYFGRMLLHHATLYLSVDFWKDFLKLLGKRWKKDFVVG
jgi:glycosyltransferase involved in cell wall biosynthesis